MKQLHDQFFDLICTREKIFNCLNSAVKFQLEHHNLTGWVASRKHIFSTVDSAYLNGHQQSTRFQNELILEECSRLQLALTEAGVQFAFIKGAALLGDIYTDIGQRRMSDIDIYIDESQAKIVKQILLNNGFFDDSYQKTWAASKFKSNFTKFLLQGNFKLQIDLHEKLFYKQKATTLGLTTTTKNTMGLNTLRREEHLFYIISHLSYVHTFEQVNWLIDVAQYIKKYGQSLKVDRLLKIAEQQRQLVCTLFTLHLVHREFNVKTINSKKMSFRLWLLNHLVDREFLLEPKKNRIKHTLVKHLLKDSIVTALSYDVRWLIAKLRGAH